MILKQTTLYYRNGSSDKTYTATLDEVGSAYFVNIFFGRRGATQQTGTKTPTAVSQSVAEAIYERLLKEKMAKGYTPGVAGTPYADTEHADQDAGIRPQLCNAIERDDVQRLITHPEWWMQPKHDGKRMLIQKKGEQIVGINRRGLTVALPQPLLDQAAKIPGDFVVDGEAIGDQLITFDLLFRYGDDIRSKSYLERHLLLMNMLAVPQGRSILLCATYCTDAEKLRSFQQLEADGAEGVVFKRIEPPYTEGRPASGGDWLKFKFHETASFVVSRHNDRRSVNLVLIDRGVAKNAGNVTIPANHSIPAVGKVVEVRYLYAFKESGHIYQPVYLGQRGDIISEECTVEQLKFKAAA